jgi:hypothetical protein
MRGNNRITERDLSRIVRKVINEGLYDNNYATVAGGGGGDGYAILLKGSGTRPRIEAYCEIDKIDDLIYALEEYKEMFSDEEM